MKVHQEHIKEAIQLLGEAKANAVHLAEFLKFCHIKGGDSQDREEDLLCYPSIFAIGEELAFRVYGQLDELDTLAGRIKAALPCREDQGTRSERKGR